MPLADNMSTLPMTSNSTRDSNILNEPTPFYEALAKALKKRKIKLDSVCPPSDPVSRRILEEYGAIFVADKKVTPPPVCVFTTEEQVAQWQDHAGYEAESFGYDEVELQPEALKKLNKARRGRTKRRLGHHAPRWRRSRAAQLRRQCSPLEFTVRAGAGLLDVAGAPDPGAGHTPEGLPLSQQVAEVLELEKDRDLL
jgi:hypothetical protein